MRLLLFAVLLASSFNALLAEEAAEASGIPIHFRLEEPGFVTLVIDDHDGKRVRNLISETPFPAGENIVYWDGLDDLDRDINAAEFAVYHVPGKLVSPGRYVVKGLVRPKIGLTYELAPYTNGKPAWFTQDPGSGWLTNHTPPSGILCLPAGVAPLREGKANSAGEQILVGSFISEGGSGLAWLDADGLKLFGQEWIGGNWTAANLLARDEGPAPVPGVYAYTGAPWLDGDKGQRTAVLRLNELLEKSLPGEKPGNVRLGTNSDRPVLTENYQVNNLTPDYLDRIPDDAEFLSGLAVYSGLLVAAVQPTNELVFIDGHQRRVLGVASVADPRGLAFDERGRLLVLSGKNLLRYEIASSVLPLGQPEVLISAGLEDPQQLAKDPAGNIYISDWGDSHQVKAFRPDGSPCKVYGVPGAPSVGAYDPLHMNHPYGIGIDSKGRLWVAEKDFLPKRVSVWDSDGSLKEAYYGPARYGGGGSLDPQDRNRFFYGESKGGMELKLDWETGKSEPVAIYNRAELDRASLRSLFLGDAPSSPIHIGERLYLANAFNTQPTNGALAAEISLLENGVAHKVAAMGNAVAEGKLLAPFQEDAFSSLLPEGFDIARTPLFFAWSDINRDGIIQPAEVVFRLISRGTTNDPALLGGVTVSDDLSFILAGYGDEAVRFRPTKVTPEGVPIYDTTSPEILVTGAQARPSSGGEQVLVGKDGWSVLTTPPKPFSTHGLAGVRDGQPVWSYPNLWPGLHASHNAAMPEFPGEVIGATRLLGNPFTPETGDAGEMWAVNGNKGNVYVFTMDGLFVTTLFQDSRKASWNAAEAVHGMPVEEFSLREECFWPTITRMRDGTIYLQVGTNDGPIRIVQVNGLDKVRRLPTQELKVDSEMLSAALTSTVRKEIARQEKRMPRSLRVPITDVAPKLDGNLDDWSNANWAVIDTRKLKTGDWSSVDVQTRAALKVANDRLYVAFQTYDPDLLVNFGEPLSTIFKSGGALDLMIGAANADPQREHPVEGDVRLLVTRKAGQPLAILYRPIDSKVHGQPIEFKSNVRTTRFDTIRDVSKDVELVSSIEKDQSGKPIGAVHEFSVPLQVLGFQPSSGLTVKGDLGILRGDGLRTLQRLYWANKGSGLVSDVPSEAMLTPRLWGTFTMKGTD